MAPKLTRQNSFISGILSSTYWAREDLKVYLAGARDILNFFVNRAGSLVSRPGTTLVRELAMSGTPVPDAQQSAYPIEFRFSDEVSYQIEIGRGYIRFHRNGATVLSDGTLAISPDTGTPYQISPHPYLYADLPFIQYVQSGNVITLSCKGHPPRELVFFGPNDWELREIDFALNDVSFIPLTLVVPGPSGSGERQLRFKVTVVAQFNKTGEKFESKPIDLIYKKDFDGGGPRELIVSHKYLLADATPAIIDFTDMGFATGPLIDSEDGYFILSWRIYAGRGLVFGKIGDEPFSYELLDGSNRFEYYGDPPVLAEPPPVGTNPFQIRGPGDDLIRTEHPRSVAYFDGRLFFAGTDERPGYVWGSVTNSFHNFDERYVATPEGMVEIKLAQRRFETMRHLVSLERLFALTDSAVYVVGAEGEAMSPVVAPTIRVIAEVGANWVRPAILPNALFYARTKGDGMRVVGFSNEGGGYVNDDASYYAHELFEGHEITSVAYQEDPDGILWVTRDDGVLLSCTYDRTLGILAWTRHETQGFVDRVSTGPEGTEDGVYLYTRRVIGGVNRRFLERMATRRIDEVADAICLDCSITYDGSPTDTVTGLDHLEGMRVWALGDGNVIGSDDDDPLIVTGGAVTLPETYSKIVVGLQYNCDVDSLDQPGSRIENRITKRAHIEYTGSRGIFTAETPAGPVYEAQYRDKIADASGAIPLRTGSITVSIAGKWTNGGRVFVRQRDPLPLTIIGITRDVEVGNL